MKHAKLEPSHFKAIIFQSKFRFTFRNTNKRTNQDFKMWFHWTLQEKLFLQMSR